MEEWIIEGYAANVIHHSSVSTVEKRSSLPPFCVCALHA